METYRQVLHLIIPCIGIALLYTGIRQKNLSYVSMALWISVIILMLHYRMGGGEILGHYFNDTMAFIYTINLLIITIGALYCFHQFKPKNKLLIALNALLKAAIFIGTAVILYNLWVNAYFLRDRWKDSPVFQVVQYNKPPYCHYRYTYFKIDKTGKLVYLCPNRYGLLPGIGHLEEIPAFLMNQVPKPLLEHLHGKEKKHPSME